MTVGQIPLGGAIVYGPEHYADTQVRASLNVRSAHCQGLRRRQHRTEHKGHTRYPRIGIKIPNPAGNRTRDAGLEGSDRTDHAKATDHLTCYTLNFF